jgi:hypothetical protein
MQLLHHPQCSCRLMLLAGGRNRLTVHSFVRPAPRAFFRPDQRHRIASERSGRQGWPLLWPPRSASTQRRISGQVRSNGSLRDGHQRTFGAGCCSVGRGVPSTHAVFRAVRNFSRGPTSPSLPWTLSAIATRRCCRCRISCSRPRGSSCACMARSFVRTSSGVLASARSR